MSGTYPASPAPAVASFQSFAPARVSVTHSLKRQVRGGDVQRWAWTLRYPPMLRADISPLVAFLVAQEGITGNFTFVPPVPHNLALGSTTATVLVDGAAQTGTTINLKDFELSTAGVLKAGDFLVFGGHAKAYMVTADVTSDGAGDAAVTIQPALVESPADGASVTYDSPPFTMHVAGETLGVAMTPRGAADALYPGFEVTLAEDA